MTRKIDKNILSRGCFCRDGDKGLRNEGGNFAVERQHNVVSDSLGIEFNRNRFQFIVTFSVVAAVDS